MKKVISLIGLLSLSSTLFAGTITGSAFSNAQRRIEAIRSSISCTSDFSVMEAGDIDVEIKSVNGKLQSFLNDNISNHDVAVSEFSIRDAIPFPIDPYSPEYANYNFGEISLNAIYEQENGIPMPDGEDMTIPTGLSFKVTDVKTLKVYDLIEGNLSSTDKFGGQILMEALDANGQVLGRGLRLLITKACK